MKHKHHILPKHFGGTDDPSNIISLSVEEHAEAHRVLYEKYGKWQDKLAWQGLSKMISKEDLIVEKLKHTAKNGGRATALKNKGSSWYYNPETGENAQLHELKDGWVKGFLPGKTQTPRRMIGEKNGMFGKSAQIGKKWYNNGNDTYYGIEGTEPKGYVRGRPATFRNKMKKAMIGNENKLSKTKRS